MREKKRLLELAGIITEAEKMAFADKFEKALERAVNEIDKIKYDQLKPQTKQNLSGFIEANIRDLEQLKAKLDQDVKIAKRQNRMRD